MLKTKCQKNKTELENKIPNTSELVKKTDYNAKITEIEGKIPHVSSLATKAYKKLTDHNHDKYIVTPEFNTMTVSVFNARLAQANLITKIKQKNYLLKIIRAILLARVILKKMVHKII